MKSKILIIFNNTPYEKNEIENLKNKQEHYVRYIDYNFVKSNKQILKEYEIILDVTTNSAIYNAFLNTNKYIVDSKIIDQGINMIHLLGHKIIKGKILENIFIPKKKNKYITKGREEEINKNIQSFLKEINLISNLLSIKIKNTFKQKVYSKGIELNEFIQNDKETKFVLVKDKIDKKDSPLIQFITLNELAGVKQFESLIKKIIN